MPLAVVRMKVERLLAGKVDGDERLQAAYRTIADENGEVIRQIDALLELVRTGKGTRRYTRTTFDLAAAVRDSATAMAGRFPPDCLTVSGCEEPVFVHADADAVRQIVRNLLEPRLIAGRLELHPFFTLAGVYVGGRLFGAAGIFIMPLAMMIFRQLHAQKNGAAE